MSDNITGKTRNRDDDDPSDAPPAKKRKYSPSATLYVRGKRFKTTMDVIDGIKKNIIHDMNSDEYIIERNPDNFHLIETYLRNGGSINLCYFDGSKNKFDTFINECKYFGITVKMTWYQSEIKKIRDPTDNDISSLLNEGYEIYKVVNYADTVSSIDGVPGDSQLNYYTNNGVDIYFIKKVDKNDY